MDRTYVKGYSNKQKAIKLLCKKTKNVHFFQILTDKLPLSCREVNEIVKSAAKEAIRESNTQLADKLKKIGEQLDNLIKQGIGRDHYQVLVELKTISQSMYNILSYYLARCSLL